MTALERVLQACEAADEEILGRFASRGFDRSRLANGLCDRWAAAVKRRLPGAEITPIDGGAHYMVSWHQFYFDADTPYEMLEAQAAEQSGEQETT